MTIETGGPDPEGAPYPAETAEAEVESSLAETAEGEAEMLLTGRADTEPARAESAAADFRPPAAAPPAESGQHISPLQIAITLCVLAVIMILQLARSHSAPLSDNRTERDLDEAQAIAETKFAYEMGSWPSAASGGRSIDEEAVRNWREIATGRHPTARCIRGYGIVLGEFGRDGSLEVFRSLAQVPVPAKGSREYVPEDSIPRAKEIACWKALCGGSPISRPEAIRLRTTLDRLNLGWMGHLALIRLYHRAHMRAEQRREEDAAQAGTVPLFVVGMARLVVILLGMAGLIALPLIAYEYRRRGRRLFSALDRAPPLPRGPLLLAFVAFLLAFSLIGYALHPLIPLLERLPIDLRRRAVICLEGAIYAPIVAITLFALLRAVRRTQPGFQFRELLRRLGVRRTPLLAVSWTALIAFVVSHPPALAAGALSMWIFHRTETPPNPVLGWIIRMRSPLDILLLLTVSSVLAPIVEELMFRGLLYRALRVRTGVLASAALSAVVFAGLHPDMPAGFLPLWVVGFSLALTYERLGSLLPNMLFHGLFNAFTTLSLLAAVSG
jgi:membrane protease YdiL (CAAX protease family)